MPHNCIVCGETLQNYVNNKIATQNYRMFMYALQKNKISNVYCMRMYHGTP